VSDKVYEVKIWNLTCKQALVDRTANEMKLHDIGATRRMLTACALRHKGCSVANTVLLEEGDLLEFRPLGLGGMPRPGRGKRKQQRKIDQKQNQKINTLNRKVNAVARKKGRGKGKGRLMRVPRPRGVTELNKYVALRRNPWDQAAWGACVPEGSRATVPFVGRLRYGISSGSAYNNGQVNLAFFPSVTLSLYVSDVSSTGFAINGQTPITAFSSNGNYFYQMTAASLASTMSAFRMVAGGVSLRSRAQTNVSQTTFNTIDLPITGHVNWSALNGVALSSTSAAYTQLTNEVSNSGILCLAGAREFTAFDIFSGYERFVFKPISPRAFDFRSTRANGTTFSTESEAEDILYVNATGVVDTTFSGLHGTTDMDGWNCQLLQCTAGSGSSTYLFQVDQIIHFEGLPLISSGGTMAPSAPRPKRGVFDSAREVFEASKEPIISFANDLGRAAGNVAGAVGQGMGYGLAQRMMNLEIVDAIQY